MSEKKVTLEFRENEHGVDEEEDIPSYIFDVENRMQSAFYYSQLASAYLSNDLNAVLSLEAELEKHGLKTTGKK